MENIFYPHFPLAAVRTTTIPPNLHIPALSPHIPHQTPPTSAPERRPHQAPPAPERRGSTARTHRTAAPAHTISTGHRQHHLPHSPPAPGHRPHPPNRRIRRTIPPNPRTHRTPAAVRTITPHSAPNPHTPTEPPHPGRPISPTPRRGGTTYTRPSPSHTYAGSVFSFVSGFFITIFLY